MQLELEQFYYYNKNDWQIQERSEGVGKDSEFQNALKTETDSFLRACSQNRSAIRYQLSEIHGRRVFFRGNACGLDHANRQNVMIHALMAGQQSADYFLQAPEEVFLWDGFQKALPDSPATSLNRVKLHSDFDWRSCKVSGLVRAIYSILLADDGKQLLYVYSAQREPASFSQKILEAMSAALHYIPLEWRTAVTFSVPGTVDDPVRLIFMQGDVPPDYEGYYVSAETDTNNLPQIIDKQIRQNLEKWLDDPYFDKPSPGGKKETFASQLKWAVSPVKEQTLAQEQKTTSDIVQTLKHVKLRTPQNETQRTAPKGFADEHDEDTVIANRQTKKTMPFPQSAEAPKQTAAKSAQPEQEAQAVSKPTLPAAVAQTAAVETEGAATPLASGILMALYCAAMAVLAFLGCRLVVWTAAWACYIVAALGIGATLRQNRNCRDSLFDGFFLCTALAVCGYSVCGRHLTAGSLLFCAASLCTAIVVLLYFIIKRRGEIA